MQLNPRLCCYTHQLSEVLLLSLGICCWTCLKLPMNRKKDPEYKDIMDKAKSQKTTDLKRTHYLLKN